MSRALLNNEKLVHFIKKNFVAVSGAVELLQPGRYGAAPSDESRWFEPIAKLAMSKFAPEFWKEFKTYQGMYVIDPSGRLYVYKVGLAYDPDEFVATLDKALRRWKSSHPEAAGVATTSTPARSYTSARSSSTPVPATTSVIEVYSRILPQPKNASLSERSVGRDLMWILSSDCRDIINAARQPGQAVKMPSHLVARMVRFQLLNHVGNIMRPFAGKDVEKADFYMRLVGGDNRLKTFVFSGTYRSAGKTDDGRQEVAGTINGEISIDSSNLRVKRFRAYGEANARGGNDSLDEKKVYPVVFVMTEARHAYARHVVPFWAALPSLAAIYENPSADILD